MHWYEYVGLAAIAVCMMIGGAWKMGGRRPKGPVSTRKPGRTGSSGRS